MFEPRDIFLDFIETRTGEDGADLGPWLTQLFEVLDTPEAERAATLDEDLARFPHVNGDLFEGRLQTFSFDATMRSALLDACRFDWSNISPAIFGELFQSVMDPAERRAQGAHYTTEKNILKVIEPLFTDDLRAEFERVKARRGRGRLAALRKFQARLGDLTFFYPACGCGNFLVITYRELRQLEIEVLREIHPRTRDGRHMDAFATDLSRVDVDQFHGIELGEFPARIAETALWMMDHIMNNRLSLEFGQTFVRIPLEKSPNIVHGDALEADWSELLPPGDCSFVLGNPPFAGAKYLTAGQRAQVRGIAALGKSGGTLDYVCAWFIKAGEYVKGGDARIGFVATNSITAGEQVAQLWPVLFGRCKLEIAFAHRTFAWGSDARGKAHVHVVILGLDQRKAARAEKRLSAIPTSAANRRRARTRRCRPTCSTRPGCRTRILWCARKARRSTGRGRFSPARSRLTAGTASLMRSNAPRFWMRSQTLPLGCDPSSERANTCMAASAGFWRCMTCRQECWRGCLAFASALSPFAPFGRAASASPP